MVDSRHFIDPERLEAGAGILALTDRVAFGAFAAGWVHDIPTGSWRYLLSTPMLKTKGPRWVYQRLLKAFRYYSLPRGVSPLDIFVIDPELEMALFGNLLIISSVPAGISFIINQDMKFPEFMVTDGFVSFYRRLGEDDRKGRRDPATSFNHKIDLLEAA